MATIRFSEVNIEQSEDQTIPHDLIIPQCLKGKKFYDECDRIIMTNTRQTQNCLPCYGNGLLGTIFQAYSHHTPLSLSTSR